ncbi:hypothetical protein BT93_B1862 [Corymbia citriodora subsp. variegata]|nr:hypothetical protein BT93_B1862 [Corymbia citriodora subsp. variegata]
MSVKGPTLAGAKPTRPKLGIINRIEFAAEQRTQPNHARTRADGDRPEHFGATKGRWTLAGAKEKRTELTAGGRAMQKHRATEDQGKREARGAERRRGKRSRTPNDADAWRGTAIGARQRRRGRGGRRRRRRRRRWRAVRW